MVLVKVKSAWMICVSSDNHHPQQWINIANATTIDVSDDKNTVKINMNDGRIIILANHRAQEFVEVLEDEFELIQE